MWGIIPAAGAGSRIQPLAFSKELLSVGGRVDGSLERPGAVSEYLVDRMIAGGATKLCFIIAPGDVGTLNGCEAIRLLSRARDEPVRKMEDALA
jgi:UTP-glucose-1-phosphate uridylyltransferase